MPVVTELRRFPVKSCRGESLTEGVVEPWGLRGDRRWMLVDDSGEAVTIRERKGMVLVHPELREDDGLVVRDESGSGLDPLAVDVPSGSDLTPVSLFGNTPFLAAVADDEAHAWFSKAVGEPVRLVHAADPTRRHANPAYAGAAVPMAFADGYPLHLTSEESLADLNQHIAAGPMAEQGPLPMVRFRPNVVVSGAPAWADDGWHRLRIGEGDLPRGQGLRALHHPHHRPRDRRAVQGADRDPGPAPSLRRRGLVRHQPGLRHPGRDDPGRRRGRGPGDARPGRRSAALADLLAEPQPVASRRSTAPSTPLTNAGDSSVDRSCTSATASDTATASGTSSTYNIS